MSQAETGTSTKSPRWYWEDFTPGLSMTFGPREVGREEIVQFARDFDPQPFHLDEEAGKASLFGGLAASGWHTADITMSLLVKSGMISLKSETKNQQGEVVQILTSKMLVWKKPV